MCSSDLKWPRHFPHCLRVQHPWEYKQRIGSFKFNNCTFRLAEEGGDLSISLRMPRMPGGLGGENLRPIHLLNSESPGKQAIALKGAAT